MDCSQQNDWRMITCTSQELGDRYHELLSVLTQSMTYALCSGRSSSWHNLRICTINSIFVLHASAGNCAHFCINAWFSVCSVYLAMFLTVLVLTIVKSSVQFSVVQWRRGEGGFGMKCMSEKMCGWDYIFAIAYVQSYIYKPVKVEDEQTVVLIQEGKRWDYDACRTISFSELNRGCKLVASCPNYYSLW